MARDTRLIPHTGQANGRVATSPAVGQGNPSYQVKVLGFGGIFRVYGTRDRKVAAIAERQRGRVARRQLLAAGLTANVIERMVANGKLLRVHAGVYAVGHLAPIEFGRETAALLAVFDEAVLSHRSASALWGLGPTVRDDEPVEITVPRIRCVARAGIRAYRTNHLDARDVCVEQGLPATSPARTLLDVASRVTSGQLEAALDAGLAANIVRLEQIQEVLERAGSGRKGAALLKALVEERIEKPRTSRSRYERILRRLIRAADLPEPETNVKLRGDLVDCLWRELRLVVEVDTFGYHGTRSMFESDRRRDAVLEAAGWIVVRITRHQLDHEPYAVIARLAQALTWARAAMPAA
jgi:very-short-patch-repair endonuclease